MWKWQRQVGRWGKNATTFSKFYENSLLRKWSSYSFAQMKETTSQNHQALHACPSMQWLLCTMATWVSLSPLHSKCLSGQESCWFICPFPAAQPAQDCPRLCCWRDAVISSTFCGESWDAITSTTESPSRKLPLGKRMVHWGQHAASRGSLSEEQVIALVRPPRRSDRDVCAVFANDRDNVPFSCGYFLVEWLDTWNKLI